jgi:hypothetical protein
MGRNAKKLIIITGMVSVSLMSSLVGGGITSYAKGPGEKVTGVSAESTKVDFITYYQSTVQGLGSWEQQPNQEWKFKLNTGGYLTNSWVESVSIAGNFYYVNNDGVMLTNTIAPGGYSVDDNGIWKKNTTTVNNTNNSGEGSRSASNSGESERDEIISQLLNDEAYLKDLREHPIDMTYSLN